MDSEAHDLPDEVQTGKDALSDWERPELAPDHFAAIIRSLNDAIIDVTLDGTVISCNPAAERLFGYSAQEIRGKSISLIIPPDRLSEESQISERIASGELIESFETQRARKDGRIIDVSLTFCPVRDSTGRMVSISRIAADIGQRKGFEIAQRDQLLLASLIACADDAIIDKDLKGVVTSWNPGAERLFGYTADEIIGKPVSILIPADRTDEETEILQRIRQGERVELYETKRARKDGRLIDVSVTVSPIKDRLGRVIGASKIIRDLSVRRRLEIAERDQLFLSAIITSAEDAIVSKDLEGKVTSWNKAAENIFGYTSEEMVGKPISILIPADHPDEEPQILQRIRRGERIDHYETQRLAKDGRLISVSLTVSPIRDRMGRVVGVSKIIRDITERKRWQVAEAAESFLGSLVDSASDAVISKTLDGIVTSWNRGAENLFGYSAAEMIGKPISILIPADHANEEPQIIQRIRRGERLEHYETKRVRKDGSVVEISLTVSPIRDRLGCIIGASKIARDITQQKLSEGRERESFKEAEEARLQAEKASLAKDEFLATISHELRTPMTAILGWARMLANGGLPLETQQKAVESIERNAKAQAQLTEDLLDISRIVSGRLRMDTKLVDMSAVIAAAIDAVLPAAEVKNIRIQTILGTSSGIVGDFERLKQVVWNLLSNAIRFTAANGVVKVELSRVESQIELQVTDSGSGIKPEFLPYVFDRFTQEDTSIARRHGGLGMGLAIVKSIVELHGGVVSASSPGEGHGAVFTIKLRINSPNDESTEPWQEPPATALMDRPELVGVKILVVDDQPDTCALVRFIFHQCGAIVETASSAAEALLLLDTWKPDILVSDVGMSDMDGYELIHTIREQRQSGIPAIALTAMARIEDRVKALTAGYQMHVAKPIEPAELISIVADLIGLIGAPVEKVA